MSDMRVQMAAFALGLRATVGQPEAHEVGRLVDMAQERLPDGHPLRRAVTTFAADYMRVRWHRGALCDAGIALRRAVDLDMVTLPPGQDRSDIHG